MSLSTLHKSLLATLGYVVLTFPLAVIWHVLLFQERYIAFGYFDDEPSTVAFTLGLLSIVVQGAAMSFLYPEVTLGRSRTARAFLFAAFMGVFLWTTHVLAFVAKQSMPQAGTFVLMETIYLALQFGLYGLVLVFTFRDASRQKQTA